MNSSKATKREYLSGYVLDVYRKYQSQTGETSSFTHLVQYVFWRPEDNHYYSIIYCRRTDQIVFVDIFTRDSIHSIFFRNNQPQKLLVYLGNEREWLSLHNPQCSRYILETDIPVYDSEYTGYTQAFHTQLSIVSGVNHSPTELDVKRIMAHAGEILVAPDKWSQPRILTSSGYIQALTTGGLNKKKKLRPVRERFDEVEFSVFDYGLQHFIRWSTSKVAIPKFSWLLSLSK